MGRAAADSRSKSNRVAELNAATPRYGQCNRQASHFFELLARNENPFLLGVKGGYSLSVEREYPLNRVPARCRDQCAAPTALPPPRHKCREALRTGAQPIVPFIYKRQPSCFSTCCGRVLKVNGTVTNIRNFLLYLNSNTIQRGMLLWLKNSLKQNRSVCSI